MGRSKIKGLDELRRKFRRLPIEQRRQLHKALRKNAEELTSMQRRIAPVQSGSRLKKSVRFKFFDPLKVEISAGDQRNKGVIHARFVEFGTKPGKMGRRISLRDKKGEKRVQERNHPGTRPDPFFYPAYRSMKRRLKSRLTRAVNKAAKAVGVKK